MATISSIVFYFLLWWTVLFTTLPFGNKPEESVTPGHAGSAPAKHNMTKKALATTVIAFLLWLPLNPMLHDFLGGLRDRAREMAAEDLRIEAERKAQVPPSPAALPKSDK